VSVPRIGRQPVLHTLLSRVICTQRPKPIFAKFVVVRQETPGHKGSLTSRRRRSINVFDKLSEPKLQNLWEMIPDISVEIATHYTYRHIRFGGTGKSSSCPWSAKSLSSLRLMPIHYEFIIQYQYPPSQNNSIPCGLHTTPPLILLLLESPSNTNPPLLVLSNLNSLNLKPRPLQFLKQHRLDIMKPEFIFAYQEPQLVIILCPVNSRLFLPRVSPPNQKERGRGGFFGGVHRLWFAGRIQRIHGLSSGGFRLGDAGG
jgi:hypothetical protein